MEFGKVDTSQLSKIDLHLPPDDPRTWIQLKNTSGPSGPPIGPLTDRLQPRVKIGCPAWGQKSWVGKVYPMGIAPKDFLSHYVTQFTSIELNTTHYRIPDRETIERWREVAPEGFTYCPKFPQEISHRRPLSGHAASVTAFIESVRGLDDRLGISFLQLPETFGPRDLEDLKKFCEQIPKDFDLALEIRHPGLFDEHRLITPLFDLLARRGIHAVITDVAGRRDVLHLSLPTRKVMVRFIGNDLHPTDCERIDEWVARLRSWIHLGLEEAQFFIHQSNDFHAPDLISYFIDRLNSVCGLTLPQWRPMNQGQQLGLF